MIDGTGVALEWQGRAEPGLQLDELLEADEARVPRAPLAIVLFISLFAMAVIVLGNVQSYFRVPYYMGVVSAMLAALAYFQYSLPIPPPVLLYLAWITWSLITGLSAEMGEATWASLKTVAQILVMFAVFATICQDSRSVWIVGSATVLGSLINLFTATSLGINALDQRAGGLLYNPNSAALLYCISICILLAGIVAARSATLRGFVVGILVLLLYGVVTTASRAGAVAAALQVLFFIWFYRRTITQKPLLLLALICISGLSAVVLPAWLSKTELARRTTMAVETVSGTAVKAEGSTQGRIELKRMALRVWTEHPIMGVGIGNFTPYVFRTQGVANSTHDNYLDILSGTGVPGFILYYSIFVWLWVVAGRLRRAPFVTSAEVSILAMTQTFLVCRAAWDLFDNTGWYYKPNWILLSMLSGFLVGLRVRVEQRVALAAEYGIA